MLNVLITGSSGYLGNSFVKNFQKDYKILRFSLLHDELKNLQLQNIDLILHCAALVHQKEKYSYQKYHDINVKYPLELAKKAKESGVRQFIFISSIAVYGDNATLINETTSCNPITPYGKSKLEAEIELTKLNDDNFIVSIIRPPMIYGQNAPGNIKTLINIVSKIKFLPFNKIKNKRSFVYIGNLLNLINIVIQKQEKGIFLAGDDEAISTTKLIKLISKELNKKTILIKIPLFPTLLKLLRPNIYQRLYGNLEINNDLTKKKLDFKNPYTVEEGIRLMVNG